MNLVVHCKRSPFDVYIGRPGPWGNPFSFKAGTRAQWVLPTREDALAAYENWLHEPEQELLLVRAAHDLRGKVLGCWCAPASGFCDRLLCHGQILAALANSCTWREVAA